MLRNFFNVDLVVDERIVVQGLGVGRREQEYEDAADLLNKLLIMLYREIKATHPVKHCSVAGCKRCEATVAGYPGPAKPSAMWKHNIISCTLQLDVAREWNCLDCKPAFVEISDSGSSPEDFLLSVQVNKGGTRMPPPPPPPPPKARGSRSKKEAVKGPSSLDSEEAFDPNPETLQDCIGYTRIENVGKLLIIPYQCCD